MKISSFVAAVILLVFSPNIHSQTANEILESMSTEEKVGQVMVWSLIGTQLDSRIHNLVSRYKPGSIIIFRRNIRNTRQLARLTSNLQSLAAKKMKAPLFIMIDQEGGVVTRVRINTPIPSALALSRVDDPEFIKDFAKTKGDLLMALGVNVNLAPVLDISNPKKDSFIGNRTFGADPENVSNLTIAYARGMNDAGVIPTAKHFPGHGGTVQDSHRVTPKKMSTLEELESRDLVPFQEFIDQGINSLFMTAHLALPNVDKSGLPTTYSPFLIQEHLREKMGFKGLVLTDDLEMKGAAIHPDIGERTIRAFLAGNDLLMLAGTPAHQRRAFHAMVNAVNQGRISMERLNESVLRILKAKEALPQPAAQTDMKKAMTAVRKLEDMSRQVMRKAFKVAIENRLRDWPEYDPKLMIPVFSASRGFYRHFRENYQGRARFYHLNSHSLNLLSDRLARPEVKLAIYYASGSVTARKLRQLTPQLREKLIVVNCNHSGEVEDQETFMTVLNFGGHSPESGGWIAEELMNPSRLEPVETRTPAEAGDSSSPDVGENDFSEIENSD